MNSAQLRTSTRASGFTLIELLVVISIIFILAGLLFPTLIQAKARGKQAKCINRCKQMNIAIQFYADEFQGYFPLDGPSDGLQGEDVWFQKLRKFLAENLDTSTVLEFVKDPGMPIGALNEVKDFKQSNYMFNNKLNQIAAYPPSGALKLVQVIDPASTMTIICGSVADLRTGDQTDHTNDLLKYPHPVSGAQADTLFSDGHVQSIKKSNIPIAGTDSFWEPQ
jgi:prepilin-type N-terminal cleavage/methylation domain-containing protein